MPDPGVWSVVRDAVPTADAPTADVVLAADFPVTGRNEGGFAELAPGLRPDCALWQTVAPQRTPDAEYSPADYLEPWLAEVRASGRAVRAVLGYCAGSVFAGALAAELARSQEIAPQVIVFDPELVDVPTVHLQFGRVIGNMTSVLSEREVEELSRTAQGLAESPGADPAGFAGALFAAFRPVGAAAFTRAGLGEDYADELVGLVGSFLSYLGVAARLDPRPGWERATVITSASTGSGLNRMRATEGIAPIKIADELRFDVEHRDLLRAPGTAEAVAGLLER
ncbi:hypothetical protein OOZ19_02870 [Saccharopolyspora sp. NFXS83]|uniref:hypothetical protein n=1 Tax=Saccharopolyspora sp. NFXS83 TaxID=2993560 RepID=UPI00224B68CC|nr:hypothetical protein [Saccharopolyspora sp. NFXS83]MCX2729171.1 hypothetical protein [Saccharopolyspora sp. NFXS83]